MQKINLLFTLAVLNFRHRGETEMRISCDGTNCMSRKKIKIRSEKALENNFETNKHQINLTLSGVLNWPAMQIHAMKLFVNSATNLDFFSDKTNYNYRTIFIILQKSKHVR